MGQSSFRRDLNRSQEAVYAVQDYLEGRGIKVEHLEGKEAQAFGDLRLTNPRNNQAKNVEIKFDIMARRTGNLCFEMSNGTKETGIMTTKADVIYYVVPQGATKDVYVFDPTELREYITTSANVKIKNGGDKKKFVLAIVSIDKIIEDDVNIIKFTI